MKKFAVLSIISAVLLSGAVFVEAQAYDNSAYYTSSKTKSKTNPRQTRASKRREARELEAQNTSAQEVQEYAAAARIDYSGVDGYGRNYTYSRIIKPLKNNYHSSNRSTKPSKLKSNYYRGE